MTFTSLLLTGSGSIDKMMGRIETALVRGGDLDRHGSIDRSATAPPEVKVTTMKHGPGLRTTQSTNLAACYSSQPSAAQLTAPVCFPVHFLTCAPGSWGVGPSTRQLLCSRSGVSRPDASRSTLCVGLESWSSQVDVNLLRLRTACSPR